MEMRFSIRESVLETDGGHYRVNLFLNVYFSAYLCEIKVNVYPKLKPSLSAH